MTEALSSYRIDSERAASAPFARAFPLLSVDHARNREAEMRLMARMLNAARELDLQRAHVHHNLAVNSAANLNGAGAYYYAPSISGLPVIDDLWSAFSPIHRAPEPRSFACP